MYTYYILHYYSRLVKGVTMRECNKQNNLPPPPEVTNEQWKRGHVTTQKCPLRWAKGGIKALYEATENYLVSLLTDANILAIHTRRITVLYRYTDKMVQPRDIQLARRIRGDRDWEYLGYTDKMVFCEVKLCTVLLGWP